MSVGDAAQHQAYRGAEAARNDAYRLYIQDTWQIRPKFSFNYGIAWSFDRGRNIISHDLDKPEYLRPLLGGPNADLSATRYDYNNFQPALGFAWSLDNKTVIRGGTGISTCLTQLVLHASRRTRVPRSGGQWVGAIQLSAGTQSVCGNADSGIIVLQPATLNFTQPTTFNGQTAMGAIPVSEELLRPDGEPARTYLFVVSK